MECNEKLKYVKYKFYALTTKMLALKIPTNFVWKLQPAYGI